MAIYIRSRLALFFTLFSSFLRFLAERPDRFPFIYSYFYTFIHFASRDEIRRAQLDIRRTKESIESTYAQAEMAFEAARTAHSDALGLLSESYALSIPNIDWQSIRAKAMDTANEVCCYF